MKVLFQYLSGAGGGLSNVILLLQAYAKAHPNDEIIVVCSSTSELTTLNALPNIRFRLIDIARWKELKRAWLGAIGLNRLAQDVGADVVWSLNLGGYKRGTVPAVLSVHNPHQVYPIEHTRIHPRSAVSVRILRYFFRRSLVASDALIVQTRLMGEYALRIPGCPSSVTVIPKSIESAQDVSEEPLPAEVHKKLTSSDQPGTLWLYVSTAIPHKNHITAMEALKRANSNGQRHRLVLTISKEEAFRLGGSLARELVGSGVLLPIGWTSKRHLKALYDACDGCLMPSVLESLSSAHLEAMQWSKPQIVADLPYARDLCGDAALYADPMDPDAWSRGMMELAESKELQAALIAKGHLQMELFPKTWAHAAASVRAVLASVIH